MKERYVRGSGSVMSLINYDGFHLLRIELCETFRIQERLVGGDGSGRRNCH